MRKSCTTDWLKPKLGQRITLNSTSEAIFARTVKTSKSHRFCLNLNFKSLKIKLICMCYFLPGLWKLRNPTVFFSLFRFYVVRNEIDFCLIMANWSSGMKNAVTTRVWLILCVRGIQMFCALFMRWCSRYVNSVTRYKRSVEEWANKILNFE